MQITISVNLYCLVLLVKQTNLGQQSKRIFANSSQIGCPLVQNKHTKIHEGWLIQNKKLCPHVHCAYH